MQSTTHSVNIQWYGEGLKAQVQEATAKGLTAAAAELSKAMKRNVGIQGPPRSLPGDFPKMETQSLRRSITFQAATPSMLAAAAGVAAGARNMVSGAAVNDYGLYLEFGTYKMAPRPWLLRSYTENRVNVMDAFLGAAKASMPKGGKA